MIKLTIKKSSALALSLITIILLVNYCNGEDNFSLVEISAKENEIDSSITANTTEQEWILIYYFYGLNCPHCANVEPYINEMDEKYYQVEVKSFEVYFDADNKKILNDFVKRYGVKNEGVPILFIGENVLLGENSIKDDLEQKILFYIENGAIDPLTYNKSDNSTNGSIPNMELTIPTIISAALVDSINPCAFSVLIFLLVYLMALGAKRRILKVGITYVNVVFTVYFLSGLGLFTIIQTTGVTRLVYNIAAGIAIVAGIINIKDFFWYQKGISLKIPSSQEPLLQKYIHKATIPAAIILGILVSLFELPCTGGVYLAILGLLSTKMTIWSGIPYLLLYNLIFILPLLGILILIYKGIPPEKVEEWRLGKRRWMRLIMGLTMILLGALMLLEVI